MYLSSTKLNIDSKIFNRYVNRVATFSIEGIELTFDSFPPLYAGRVTLIAAHNKYGRYVAATASSHASPERAVSQVCIT